MSADQRNEKQKDLFIDQEWGPRMHLITALLGGTTVSVKGRRPKTIFVKPESKEELDARKYLADLLRSEFTLPRILRNRLANLFDPDPTIAGALRYAKLVSRRKKDEFADFRVASFAQALISKGRPLKQVWSEIEKDHGLSAKSVERIYYEQKKQHPDLFPDPSS